MTELGGRDEVEKNIAQLQDAEARGEVEKINLLIFDLDRAPTERRSTKFVRVIQWDRYCLENYLIDERVLFDVIMPNSKRPPESRGTFSNELKGLALGQLTDAVIARVYREFEPPNAGLRPSEVFGKDFNVAAGVLVKRILEIRNQTMTIVSDEWVREFSLRCEAVRTSMSEEWSREWIKKCNGKRLIQDLYRKYQIGMDQLTFKKRIIRQMQADASESWRIVESTIRNGLQ